MNRLVRFYRGEEPDHAGRRIGGIQAYSGEELDDKHDFIQWLFPLPEPSPVNPDAPVLDEETIAEFQSRPELRAALLKSLCMMIAFYGFELRELPALSVERGAGFARCAANWLRPGNHNHLRLRRILRSTHLLGLKAESEALFRALEQIYQSSRGQANITAATFRFWQAAVEGNPDSTHWHPSSGAV
jgi:hypothetical protein